MKRVTVVVFSSWIALLSLGLLGCGGASNAAIGVGLTSGVAGNAIDQAQTVAITASVTNDSKSAGVTWSVSGGGTLTAQSTTSATFNAPTSVTRSFVATVTATSVSDATKSASLQIRVNPLPSITVTSLPAATAGTAYNNGVGESGGTSPYQWTITSGTLPLGLLLGATTGVVSGTPTGVSSGSLTFQVVDAAGNSSSQALSFTVNPAPALTIATNSLPGAALGVAYSQTLQATGGVPSYKWAVTAGTLPAGLTLSSAGAISGTPTGTTGTSNFTVTVTDSQTPTPSTTSANLSITVALAPLSVTTSSLANGVIGAAYSQTLQASGGTPPYTWSVISGTLPASLGLNASTGAITGTPSASGTSSFTVKVTDSASGTATANLSITVNAALSITTTSPLPGGSVGTAYSTTIVAAGGLTPYSWTISGNPSWLSINKTTGVLSGTPTATGTSTFAVQVSDNETPPATTSANFSLTVAAQSCTNNSSLKGNYALIASGWSGSTAAASLAGSFLADGNGNLTTGLIDISDQSSGSGPASGTFTGTYCVASNNLATLNLTYAGGLSGTDTLVATLNSSDHNGHIISYDNSDRKVSGLLRQQDTSAFATSKIDGNYAFGIVGTDVETYRFAMAGEFNSNGSGTLSGETDSDDAGLIQTAQSLRSSNFSVASSGRATATINSTIGNTNFVFYVVSSSEMLMMAFDTTETPPIVMAGQVLQQSGSFTDASLDGVSVIELQALSNNGTTPSATAGLVTTTGNAATFTFSADQNQGGTMSTPSDSGTFSVSSNGRVTLTSNGGGAPVFYLVAKNQAFAVGTDGSASFGVMQPQTGSDFTISSFSGNYLGGTQPPTNASVNEDADYLNSNGSGTLTGTLDENGSAGPQTGPISGTYSVSSNGRVVVSASGTPIVYLYIISTSQAVALPASSAQHADTNPALIDFHQ
ncbi:MAG: putative Ig domain-containing protein [Terriglobales bacterium]